MNIPIGISNNHIHLSQKDADILFGKNYQFKVLKELSQPGQFACEEFVSVEGPKRIMDRIKVLGPLRKETQVELSISDCYYVGIKPVIKLSGSTEGTPGIKVIGPNGSVLIEKGVMVAQRHIHMNPSEAETYGIKHGDTVSIRIDSPRGLIFNNVAVRVHESFSLDFHIDIEEANAAGVTNDDSGTLIK